MSIAADGNLLAVATSSNVKVFGLRQSDWAIRVKKLDIPSELAALGARSITISPDCRWLVVVSRSSNTRVYRIVRDDSTIRILDRHFSLRRLSRQDTSSKYDRTITNVAFSADSRILVVADLAGYIDSWALEGYEDLEDLRNEASSSDSDSETERRISILGQSWIRNPSASLLPRLPSPCLVLSFRPTPPSPAKTGLLHATRHNPRPHSYELPSGEDRLLVITSTHQVFEFSIMSGNLSPWSRRNPTSTFPLEFLDLRDRTKGCVWDIENGKQRVWLYGISWVWMFDLAQDFPTSAQNPAPKPVEATRHTDDEAGARPVVENGSLDHGPKRGKKRKRRAKTSGAGSTMPSQEVTRIVEDGEEDGPEDEEWNGIDAEDEENLAFAHLRRESVENGVGRGEDQFKITTQSPGTWHTFKYRPILGMVPMNIPGQGPLEVALVERPLWDADLPPRFYGDQEWDAK